VAYNDGMLFSRRVLVFLALSWGLVALYPDPTVLLTSVRNLLSPRIQADAAGTLAASLPDDPRAIESIVLDDVVPYATDWEAAGVPWSFPSAAEALRAQRGDCESRAVVLASVLAAKGIPYELRMSFDHIWVDYPGKVPTALENDARVLADRDGGGWSALRWPEDLDLGREARAQAAIYWDPMPAGRKALLFGGLGVIALWTQLAAFIARPGFARARDGRAIEMRRSPTPWTAGGPS
jgi:hypothetical protein